MKIINTSVTTTVMVIIIIVLASIAIGISYKASLDSKKLELVLANQKKHFLTDLAESKKTIEAAIDKNSLFKNQFINEHQKVITLQNEISKTIINIDNSNNYNQQVYNLKQVIITLIKERNELEKTIIY